MNERCKDVVDERWKDRQKDLKDPEFDYLGFNYEILNSAVGSYSPSIYYKKINKISAGIRSRARRIKKHAFAHNVSRVFTRSLITLLARAMAFRLHISTNVALTFAGYSS